LAKLVWGSAVVAAGAVSAALGVGAPVAGAAVGAHRRRFVLVLPGFPQQKQRKGKDDKKDQPLVIHETGRV
jgi:hypothetical protein